MDPERDAMMVDLRNIVTIREVIPEAAEMRAR